MYRHYGCRNAERQGVRRLTVVLWLLIVLCATPMTAAAQNAGAADADVWERAREAVQYNRLSEALPLLEIELNRNPTNVEALRMLAAVREQTGRLEAAETGLRQAIARDDLSGPQRSRLAFDLAGLLGRREMPEDAVEMYTTSLEYDSAMAAAYLNRANTRAGMGDYPEAVEDYGVYLALRPDAPQRPKIQRMIDLLNESIAAEERRLAEEERRRQDELAAQRAAEEEARRQEEEARRLAEQRRQEMLSSVLQSLGDAEEDAESFELESEDIQSYEEELDIVD